MRYISYAYVEFTPYAVLVVVSPPRRNYYNSLRTYVLYHDLLRPFLGPFSVLPKFCMCEVIFIQNLNYMCLLIFSLEYVSYINPLFLLAHIMKLFFVLVIAANT